MIFSLLFGPNRTGQSDNCIWMVWCQQSHVDVIIHHNLCLILTSLCVWNKHATVVQPNPINLDFGRAVAKRRDQLGMTQAELSGLTGLSRASIASIEKGRQNVLLHHVYELAQALQFRHVGDLLPARPSARHRELEVRVLHGQLSDGDEARVRELIGRWMPADEAASGR